MTDAQDIELEPNFVTLVLDNEINFSDLSDLVGDLSALYRLIGMGGSKSKVHVLGQTHGQ